MSRGAASRHGEDDGAVFAALALVHGDGPGVLELDERVEAHLRDAPVEVHGQRLVRGVDGEDLAHVAVIYARAVSTGPWAGLLSPYHIIVVADLHHPVALAEGDFAENFLVLALAGGLSAAWSR